MNDYKSQREYLKLYTAAIERFAETKKPYISSSGHTVDKKFLAQCEKTLCSFFKTGSKKTKGTGTGKKNVGFTKLFYFAKSVVDYHGDVLREAFPNTRLPSFEKFMPDGVTPNPLYRILSHPLMTRVFSLTARITGQKKKYYYSATEKFILSHTDQINEARAKDEAKGHKDYTLEEFENIFKTTKNFSGYLFNAACYTHAHQSKIIETSKDKTIDLIDDILDDEEKDTPGYQKKLDDIQVRSEKGIKLSDIKAQVLAVYELDMNTVVSNQEANLVHFKESLESKTVELVDSAESAEVYSTQDLEDIEGSDTSDIEL